MTNNKRFVICYTIAFLLALQTYMFVHESTHYFINIANHEEVHEICFIGNNFDQNAAGWVLATLHTDEPITDDYIQRAEFWPIVMGTVISFLVEIIVFLFLYFKIDIKRSEDHGPIMLP